jgi:hypothetical protein
MGRLECGPRKAVPLRVIASAASEDLEKLMDGARERARLDVISAKHEAESVEEQLQNMRRERLLPDDKVLEKISRYEARLSRLMFKALHELEALQVRRVGGAPPLARLDVDGLAGNCGRAFATLRARQLLPHLDFRYTAFSEVGLRVALTVSASGILREPLRPYVRREHT